MQRSGRSVGIGGSWRTGVSLLAAVTALLLGLAALLPGACGGSDDPQPPREVTYPEGGGVAVDGHRLLLGESLDPAHPLWLVAGDRAGEGLGLLVDRNLPMGRMTLSGVVYSAPDGDGLEVALGPDGLPDRVSFANDIRMQLSGYTDRTVDVRILSATGEQLARETVEIPRELREMRSALAELSLQQPAPDAAVQWKEGGMTPYERDAFVRKALLRLAGTTLAVGACAGSALVAKVAPIVTFVACASAYHGVVSLVQYVTGVTVLGNPDADDAGNIATAIDLAGCIGLKPVDCLSVALALIDALIADCLPANPEYGTRCHRGDVWYHDDCGIRTAPVERCPCGCVSGACIPIETCTGPLGKVVEATATPPCVAVGEPVLFSSAVVGGDAATRTYQWSFGDGGGSALPADAHAWATPGRRTVTLTVEDDRGNVGFAAVPIQVENCERFLEVRLRASRTCANRGQPVDFVAQIRGGTGQHTFLHAFGDGFTAPAEGATHRYRHEGVYNASVTVTDDLGRRATDALSITVGPCPDDLEVRIGGAGDCQEPGEPLVLHADVRGAGPDGLRYFWNLGEGTEVASTPVVRHTWRGDRIYPVTLTVQDARGRISGETIPLRVGGCDDPPSSAPPPPPGARTIEDCDAARSVRTRITEPVRTVTGRGQERCDADLVVTNTGREPVTFYPLWPDDLPGRPGITVLPGEERAVESLFRTQRDPETGTVDRLFRYRWFTFLHFNAQDHGHQGCRWIHDGLLDRSFDIHRLTLTDPMFISPCP